MPKPLHPLYNAASGDHPLPEDGREIEAVLRAERLAWIPQAEFDQLAAAFDSACGGGFGGAGGLLAAAVCDERCGLAEAVPSLTSWLCDLGRFSPQWCDAAAQTLESARKLAARRLENPS